MLYCFFCFLGGRHGIEPPRLRDGVIEVGFDLLQPPDCLGICGLGTLRRIEMDQCVRGMLTDGLGVADGTYGLFGVFAGFCGMFVTAGHAAEAGAAEGNQCRRRGGAGDLVIHGLLVMKAFVAGSEDDKPRARSRNPASRSVPRLRACGTVGATGEDAVAPFRCSRSEFSTTETELNAIGAEAIIGFSLPSAATGIATVLIGISPDLAAARGIDPRWHDAVYLICIALTVALGVRIVGGLMTAALLAIPACTAGNVSRNLKQYGYVSTAAGGLASVLGIVGHAATGLPAGPLIVIASGILFLGSVYAKVRSGETRPSEF